LTEPYILKSPRFYIIFVMMLCAFQLQSFAQCPGGALWINTPVNGTLIDSATLQVLDTIKVSSTNPTSGTYSSGRPIYSANGLSWGGYPYQSISVIRGGGRGASTTFKLKIAVDSSIMHFRISDIRGDGLNVEHQRILGYNNGVPVSATANEFINGVSYNPLTGNINGGSTTTTFAQSSIRIFFNGPVDSVVIRSISLNDAVVFELAARCDVILPVHKVDLTAKNKSNGVQLSWNITGEADKIEIERSGDDNIWYPLPSLAGNIQEFFDSNPFQETNFYRLKITDNVGNTKYSNVVFVKRNRTNNLQTRIYPNPFKDFITCESDVKIVSYKLYSSTGTIILSKKITGTNSFTEKLPSTLSKGIYQIILRYKNGEERSYKLIKDF
jgi:Secretion system C-terminal sorting domain